MINSEVEVDAKLPTDDFYLQWSHIFWWQVKFNIFCALHESFKKNEEVNDLELKKRIDKDLEGTIRTDEHGRRWIFRNGLWYGMCYTRRRNNHE